MPEVLTLAILAPENTAQDPATKNLITQMTTESGSSSRTFKSALIWVVPEDATSLLDEARSAFVPALRRLGYSVNSVNPEELKKAQEELFVARDYVKAYTSDRYTELMRSREVWVAQAYSGDIVDFQRNYPAVRYVLPEEGTEIWVDNVCITKEARNPEMAHALINFLLRANIAADFTNTTGYPTANKAARASIKPEILSNPAAYPPDSMLEKSEFIKDAGEANDLYDSYWHDAKLPPSMRDSK